MTAQKISVNWAYGWRKGEEVKGKAGKAWGRSWCCFVYYWSAAAPHPPSKPFQFPTLFIISNSPSHSLPLPVPLASVSHTTWHETKYKKGGSEDWKPPHQTHTRREIERSSYREGSKHDFFPPFLSTLVSHEHRFHLKIRRWPDKESA